MISNLGQSPQLGRAATRRLADPSGPVLLGHLWWAEDTTLLISLCSSGSLRFARLCCGLSFARLRRLWLVLTGWLWPISICCCLLLLTVDGFRAQGFGSPRRCGCPSPWRGGCPRRAGYPSLSLAGGHRHILKHKMFDKCMSLKHGNVSSHYSTRCFYFSLDTKYFIKHGLSFH